MPNSFFGFCLANSAELLLKIQQQLTLVCFSVLLAIAMAFPAGVLISLFPRFKNLTLGLTSVLWTIPSLAMFGILIPFVGIGIKPAVIVLTLYALLPILQNTVTGIASVDPAAINAALGLGFTEWQSMRLVKIPLALPIILSGIRTATTMNIGVATLAAFIGAGGLGDFINRGLATNNSNLILLGALPAALLALCFDRALGNISVLFSFEHIRQKPRKMNWIFPGTVALLLVLVFANWIYFSTHSNSKSVIRIATKKSTEQYLLGEMLAELIEANTALSVERVFNLGTTDIIHKAMQSGDIDLYPEYTGTAFLTVLKQPYRQQTPEQIYQFVKSEYENRYNLRWLDLFGFQNQQAFAVIRDFAKRYHLSSIEDLAKIDDDLKIAAPPEFISREDGLALIRDSYHLQIADVKTMDHNLSYQALQEKSVNLIVAFTTDPELFEQKIVILRDSKNSFPPYFAAPVIRATIAKRYPNLVLAIAPIFGKIDNATMQHLNYLVDVAHQSPQQVAHQFLVEQRLLKP